MPAFVVRRKYLITTPILVFDREPYCELETYLKIVSHDTRPLDFRKVWTPESWVLDVFGLIWFRDHDFSLSRIFDI